MHRATRHDQLVPRKWAFTMSAMGIGASQSSQICTDTPWRAYVEGENAAIDAAARRGAPVFLRDALLAHRAQEKRRIARCRMLCRVGREPERAFMSAMLKTR
jgi:hypothetical protein